MKNELHITVYESDVLKIQTIKSFGFKSAEGEWFDQNEEEVVLIIRGRAVLQFDDKNVSLEKGDKYIIKRHEKHRILYTSKNCEWYCVYIK